MFEMIVSVVTLIVKWYTASSCQKSRYVGWWLLFISGLIWLSYFIYTKQYWVCVYSTGSLFISLRGVWNNRKKK